MKNLSHFDIVEKVVSFETGGWDNAKKGIYQIKDTYVNFWFKFVFPYLSDLYLMTPSAFMTHISQKNWMIICHGISAMYVWSICSF